MIHHIKKYVKCFFDFNVLFEKISKPLVKRNSV